MVLIKWLCNVCRAVYERVFFSEGCGFLQDVVKTRMQLAQERSSGILPTLSTVARQEGLRGLFAGVTPRAMKAAPACAIVLASYECLQLVVKNNAQQEA